VLRNNISKRRELLPWWIKFFIWVFMLIGASAIFVNFWEIVGLPINFWFVTESSIYGMETYDRFSILGVFVSILIIFKGYTAFAMWTQRELAIRLGIVDAGIGIIVCVIMMIVEPFFELENGTWNINLRFEILLLTPYLIKCYRIRKVWEEFDEYNCASEKINIQPKEVSEIEHKSEIKTKAESENKNEGDDLDKEDPRRFMPK
jgi:hypothetical protein